MSAEELREKLLNLICDERDFFVQKDAVASLIDIVTKQRWELESIERAYPTSGERMGHQDFAKRALRDTDEKLKAMGVL